MKNKNILIVGASQGIGAAMALELAEEGNSIALVSRRFSKLQEVAKQLTAKGAKTLCLEADALDTARAVEVVEEVTEHFGTIDLAILIVGGAPPGISYEMPVQEINGIMELNYHSLINYFNPLIAQFRKQKNGGQLAHMNSLASLLPLPISSFYSSSKVACRYFLEAARLELQSEKIDICILCPGFMSTEGFQGIDPSPAPIMKPAYAAKKMIRAIEQKKRLYAFPFSLVFLIRLSNYLPFFLLKRIQKKLIAQNRLKMGL